MPWQQLVADVSTEVLDDGSWAYTVVVITVQRQAGKTTLTGGLSCHRCLTKRDALCWLTAQKRQDARDTMGEIAKKAMRSPFASLLTYRRSNGSEGLTFSTGSSFRVFAPTEDALHGKSNELVAVDEGWAFDAVQGAELEQAILPTFTTTGGQLFIVSTAGTAKSAWLRGFVDRGRAAVEAGKREGIAYFEWSLDDQAAADVERLMDPTLEGEARELSRRQAYKLILAAHPGAGYTLKLKALAQAADTMAVGEFMRAYGNRWTHVTDSVIPEHLWNGLRASFPAPEAGTVGLAFDVTPDRSEATITASWTEAGKVRVDVVDHGPGDRWLVARLVELRRKWRVQRIGYDKQGPALDIADELRTQLGREQAGLGDIVVGTTASEYAAACAGFLADVTNGRLEHRGSADLDAAVAAAGKRALGDGGWLWSRRESAASISALVSATQARWAVLHRPEPAPAPVVAVRRAPGAAVAAGPRSRHRANETAGTPRGAGRRPVVSA